MKVEDNIYIVNEEGISIAKLSKKYRNGDWLALFECGKGIMVRKALLKNEIAPNTMHNNRYTAREALITVCALVSERSTKLLNELKANKDVK